MKQKNVNWPRIKANDIKVLGQVVSIAANNKLAHAEQIFDKEFDYINYNLADFIEDGESKGFDQYTINRLFSSKLVSLEGAVANLSSRVDALEEWKDTVDGKLDKIDTLEACCEDVQSRLSDLEDCCEEVQSKLDNVPTGGGDASFTVSPNTVDLILGDPQEGSKQLTLSKGSDLTGNFTFTGYNESKISVSSEGLITALSTGSTTITVGVEGFARTEDVTVNISAPAPVEYSLFYKDGTRVIDEQHYVENAVITPIADPVKEGYTFTGWDGMPASMRMPNLNISVYATWEENEQPPVVNTYILTYKSDDAVLSTQTYEEGATITPIANPTKSGYTFTGWSPAVPATMPANDLTVIAQWEENAPVGPDPIYPESISIDGPDRVKVGTTGAYTATITPSNADTDTAITWSIEDGIGTVNQSGVYTAPDRTGVAYIKVTTANGKTATKFVDIWDDAPVEPDTHNYYITLNKSSETITSGGDGFTLSATLHGYYNGLEDQIIPKTGETITWTSSNTNAATVNNSGVVSPVDNLTANATTNVIAHWTDPNGDEQTATCAVTVNKKPTTEYTLTAFPATVNLTVGGNSESIDITLSPEDPQGLRTWVLTRSDDQSWQSTGSGNPRTVQISPAADANDPNGVVITFTATVEGQTVTANVTAITHPAETPVQNEHKATFFDPNLGEGEEDQYAGASHPAMSWYPNAFKLGETTFYAGSRQQDFERLGEAQAKAAAAAAGHNRVGYSLRWDIGLYDTMPDMNIDVKALWDAKNRDIIYKDGNTVLGTETYYTGATINPQVNATKEGYTLTGWTGMPADMKMPGTDNENDPLIVTANWTGNYEFTVEPTELSLREGNTHAMTARLNGTATTQNITWSSSDSSIASVASDGTVTGVAAGNVTITATTTDDRASNKTATCTVTVVAPDPHLMWYPDANTNANRYMQRGGDPVELTLTVYDMPEGGDIRWYNEQEYIMEEQNTNLNIDVTQEYVTGGDGTEHVQITLKDGADFVNDAVWAVMVDANGNPVQQISSGNSTDVNARCAIVLTD